MYWIEVDGYPMPKPIGGHPAIELCNTWAGWDEPDGGEYLTDYDRAIVWSRHAGLIGESAVGRLRSLAGERPRQATAQLHRLRRLRTALYRTLRDRDEAGFGTVARLAERAAARQRFHRAPDGTAGWELPDTVGLELPVLASAGAAAELLASPQAATVRACPGDGCGWLFGDPRGRRRWCSMDTCGNRAKVRRFAARRR